MLFFFFFPLFNSITEDFNIRLSSSAQQDPYIIRGTRLDLTSGCHGDGGIKRSDFQSARYWKRIPTIEEMESLFPIAVHHFVFSNKQI